MQSLGHTVEESHPAALDENEFVERFNDVVCAHAKALLDQIGTLFGREIKEDDLELWTWTLAQRGARTSASQYLASILWLQVWTRRVARWWSEEKFDLLLTPTLVEPPPPLGTLIASKDNPTRAWQRVADLIQFTPQYNATGQPAMSLPLYWNAAGLPIGIQLVAAFGREDLLIQVAAQAEQARPWKDRRPPVCA